MKFWTIVILLLVSLQDAKTQTEEINLDVTFKVYDDLVEGLKGSTSSFPELVIVDDSSGIAVYSPYHNQIRVSKKALGICKSFDDQFEDALSFVLGHELIHSTQSRIIENQIETSFLKNTRSRNTRKSLEEEADVKGAFNAYLAGYNVAEIGAQLLDRIYEDYGLIHKQLNAYPSLPERKNTFSRVMEKVDTLIHLWEAGTFLLAFDKFDLAFPVYEEILKSYQGKEVYNNLGVAYLLKAIHFSEYNFDTYAYPVEIDFVSRLKRKPKPKDSKLIPIEEQRLRSFYLIQAKYNFDKALELDPFYVQASINLVSTLVASGEYELAEAIADKASALIFIGDQTSYEKLLILKALSKMSRSNQEEVTNGQEILETMLQNPGIQNRHLIESNLYLHRCESQDIQPYSEQKQNISPRSKSIQFRPSQAIQIGNRHKAWFYYTNKNSYRTLHLQSDEQRVAIKLVEMEDSNTFSQLPDDFTLQETRSATYAVNKELGQIYFRSKARKGGLRVELGSVSPVEK